MIKLYAEIYPVSGRLTGHTQTEEPMGFEHPLVNQAWVVYKASTVEEARERHWDDVVKENPHLGESA